jgi:16S rRNA processing protein RimM
MSDPEITKKNTEANDIGSLGTGEPVFILIGKIRKPHGVDGELLIDAYSESPERFKAGKQIFIGEDHELHVIKTRRMMDKAMLITFKDVDDVNLAGQYRNKYIYTIKEYLPSLPDGEYYHFDLVGLNVYDQMGVYMGKLKEVLETGANDVYVVENEAGEEILLPAIASVIIAVSLSEHKMIVDPPIWY